MKDILWKIWAEEPEVTIKTIKQAYKTFNKKQWFYMLGKSKKKKKKGTSLETMLDDTVESMWLISTKAELGK